MALDAAPARYSQVFEDREYRALWAAQVLSLLGDQLARVALAVLVFSRTHSAAATAAAYALTFLPWLVVGPILSGLADRLPRREVMVGCDLVRAALLAGMALPRVPIWLLCVLIFAAEMFEPPFSAARAALLPDLFPDDRYTLANAVAGITREFGQLLGFAGGGIIVLALHPRGALLADAVTFVASALIVALGIARRRAPLEPEEVRSPLRHLSHGAAVIFGDRWLRALVSLAWLCAAYVVPEGLAAPLASDLRQGPLAVGLILAAVPAGSVVGAYALARYAPPLRRLQLMAPLALLSVAPLVLAVFRPSLPVLLVLLALSGLGSSYNLPANAAFVAAVPSTVRGQAFGVVQSGMYIGQGLVIVAAGGIAQVLDPFVVVALSGALGILVAVAVSRTIAAGVRSLPAAAVGEEA